MKIRKLTLAYYYHPRILFEFHHLSKKGTSLGSCALFDMFLISLEKFLTFSLTFMTLTLVKITDLLFCEMSLSLGLPDVSLLLDSDYAHWSGISQK